MTRQGALERTTSAGAAGPAAGALANGALLAAVHVWPGWQVVPFLTAETSAALGAVDAMLVAGIVVNLVLLVGRPARLRPTGTLITSVFGLIATVRVLQVFPFAFAGGFDWAPVIRVLLVLGAVGSAIGAVVAVVALLRLHRITLD